MNEKQFDELREYVIHANLSLEKWDRLKKRKNQVLVTDLIERLYNSLEFIEFRRIRTSDVANGNPHFWENARLFGFGLKENKIYVLARRNFRAKVAELFKDLKTDEPIRKEIPGETRGENTGSSGELPSSTGLGG